MNEYRITFASETGETSNIYVTERTEASARKSFNSSHKGMGFTIQEIELHRTDASATKQQERDTLEAIKKMVEELGPQSYLATAFAGCFEIAEQNIEYDFGDSMKGRLESAEKKLDKAEKKIKTMELDNRDLRNAIEKVKADLAKTEQSLKDLTLSPDDLEDVRQLLADRVDTAEHTAEQAASEIVQYADDPSSKEFRQAVADHRNFSGTAKYYRELLGRVVAAQAAHHAGA